MYVWVRVCVCVHISDPLAPSLPTSPPTNQPPHHSTNHPNQHQHQTTNNTKHNRKSRKRPSACCGGRPTPPPFCSMTWWLSPPPPRWSGRLRTTTVGEEVYFLFVCMCVRVYFSLFLLFVSHSPPRPPLYSPSHPFTINPFPPPLRS